MAKFTKDKQPIKRGNGKVSELRQAIIDFNHSNGCDLISDVLNKLFLQAQSGDQEAIKLFINRLIPPVRARELPIKFTLKRGSILEQSKSLLAACSKGMISVDECKGLLSSLGSMIQIEEVQDLRLRIEELEKAHLHE